MNWRHLLLSLGLLASLTACGTAPSDAQTQPPDSTPRELSAPLAQMELPTAGEEIVVMETNMGTMKLRLFPQDAPLAVENFKGLIEQGYYNGVGFHRIIENFMIQGGDPEGTGRGGESIWGKGFDIELPQNLHFYRGALAMANTAQPKSNGSQFFIVQNPQDSTDALTALDEAKAQDDARSVPMGTATVDLNDIFTEDVLAGYEQYKGTPQLEWLFGQKGVNSSGYTVFGQVFEGFDVVDAIAGVATGAGDKPTEPVVMKSVMLESYQP